jgi:hypothetical protein
VEHIYRGYRISIRMAEDGWHAKFWHVNGAPLAISAKATHDEGGAVCLNRAAQAIDRYIAYVGPRS